MNHDLHTLTGAYAANALDDVERRAFEQHLDDCPSCAAETRELCETASRLAAATIVTPRPALKADVLARIETVRQLPPPVDVTADAGAGSDRSAGARPGRRSVPARWLVAVAAAALVAALASVPTALHYRGEARESAALTATVNRVLAAPDALTVSATGTPWQGARLVASPSRNEAVLLAGGVPSPGAGRTYELWVIGRGGTPRPAGTFEPGPDARVTRPMAADMTDATAIAVTVEPAGGVDKPTGSPVATFPMPTA
jgi:anti-sigma-K factor RskA